MNLPVNVVVLEVYSTEIMNDIVLSDYTQTLVQLRFWVHMSFSGELDLLTCDTLLYTCSITIAGYSYTCTEKRAKPHAWGL